MFIFLVTRAYFYIFPEMYKNVINIICVLSTVIFYRPNELYVSEKGYCVEMLAVIKCVKCFIRKLWVNAKIS